MRRSVSNSQRSGKYPIENWDAKKTLKNIARVCSERNFSHVAFHVCKASTEQKSAKTDVFRRFWQREGSGSGPRGPREAVRGGSGKGPKSVLNGFDVVLYPSYVRIGPVN